MITLGIVLGTIDIGKGSNEFQLPQNVSSKLSNDGTYLISRLKNFNSYVLNLIREIKSNI